jgi:glutaminase
VGPHLLLNFGMVHEEVEAALDLYFKQCSILGLHVFDCLNVGSSFLETVL